MVPHQRWLSQTDGTSPITTDSCPHRLNFGVITPRWHTAISTTSLYFAYLTSLSTPIRTLITLTIGLYILRWISHENYWLAPLPRQNSVLKVHLECSHTRTQKVMANLLVRINSLNKINQDDWVNMCLMYLNPLHHWSHVQWSIECPT